MAAQTFQSSSSVKRLAFYSAFCDLSPSSQEIAMKVVTNLRAHERAVVSETHQEQCSPFHVPPSSFVATYREPDSATPDLQTAEATPAAG